MLLVCLLLGLFRALPAQSQQWVSTSQLEFELLVSGEWLMEGQTLNLLVRLGEPTDPAEGIAGLDAWVDLQGVQPTTTPPTVNLQQSWLLGTGDSVQAGFAASRLSLFGVRSDSAGQDGAGEVMRISLVCTRDSQAVSEVIRQGGGLVMVENVDLKRLSESTAQELTAYPNPVRDVLQVRAVTRDHQRFVLLDQWGRLVRTNLDLFALRGQVNLHGLPPGHYYLLGHGPQGQPIRLHILKE